MANLLKGAVVGAIALGGVAAASSESFAMPVGDLTPAITADAGQSLVQNVWWRYGYGWHRPWGWRYGWRRPLGWRYGYGWRRPWGWRVYHPWGWRRW